MEGVATGLVKLSSLGDVIHSLITLPLLREKGRQISFFVDSSFAEILDGNPAVAEVVPIPLRQLKRQFQTGEVPKSKLLRQLMGLIGELSRYSFPEVIDLQGLVKSGILSYLISNRKGRRVGQTPPRERVASLFYTDRVPVTPEMVAAERYMAVAGVYNREFLIDHPPLIPVPRGHFPELDPNRPNVAFVIGSTWECRKLPVESWVEIGRGLAGANLIIPYGTPAEEEYGRQILDQIGGGHLCHYPLRELRVLLSQVDLIVGHDTGPVFIGWANNIPNVIIYTCTYRNKILENRYCRSVEVQRGRVDRELFNSHLVKPEEILREIEQFKL